MTKRKVHRRYSCFDINEKFMLLDKIVVKKEKKKTHMIERLVNLLVKSSIQSNLVYFMFLTLYELIWYTKYIKHHSSTFNSYTLHIKYNYTAFNSSTLWCTGDPLARLSFWTWKSVWLCCCDFML